MEGCWLLRMSAVRMLSEPEALVIWPITIPLGIGYYIALSSLRDCFT